MEKDRIHFKSVDAKEPHQIRRELRDLFEGGIPFTEAIEMVGAGNHPLRPAFAAAWGAWLEAA
jgi:hypothetical protein